MFSLNHLLSSSFVKFLCSVLFEAFDIVIVLHGSELQLSLGREGEASNTPLNVKPLVVAMEASSSLATSVPTSALPEGQAKPCLLKWKGPKKINRIYADWLDDLPLSPSSASKLEG